tara:strand:+ start:456 stop:1772 length:1317 start_codon:yes stop_codon:yes gene_type:complete
MITHVKRVVIVGGGSSGWLTAASLYNNPALDVTLIDKEVSTPVSVGEATLLNFENWLENHCGFNSEEFLAELDIGLKAGILFPDWGYEGSNIWHPFLFPPGEKHLYECSMNNMVDKNRLEDSYAYHIDCIKLIEYIKKKIHINFIQSGVNNIERDDSGISSLTLENGEVITADLYVDCTGFKSILKDKRDRVDLSDRLYVDSAIAGHVNYIDEKEFHPYVSCPAVDHGWIWKIPLRTRIGTGLVFNRTVTDIEEAKEYFSDYWNGRADNLRFIDWTPYYDTNMWDKNVVSIGLSAGFIEPLESTGLALIIEGIHVVSRLIRSGYYNQYDIDYFNTFMVFSFESYIDFVNGHYSKSYKDTKFWRYVRDIYKPSKTLEFYINHLNSYDDPIVGGKELIFGGSNWIEWLTQMGYNNSLNTFEPEPTTTKDLVNHLELLYGR